MTATVPTLVPLRHGAVLAWTSFLALAIGTVLIGVAYFVNAFAISGDDQGLAIIGATLYLMASLLWLSPSFVIAMLVTSVPRSGQAMARACYAAIVGVVGGIASVTSTRPRIGEDSDTALLLVILAGLLAVAPLLSVMVRGALRRPA
jgi:hypothetical protein